MDSLTLTLVAPDVVRSGTPVLFELRLRNAGEATVHLAVPGRPPAFDLVVTDGTGRVVWRRLEGAVIAMALQLVSLAPGEELVLQDTWDLRDSEGRPVPPGRYGLTGVLPAEEGTLRTTQANLTIVSG
jgi:hypothetical protein